MSKSKFGIMKQEQTQYPIRELVKVPHEEGVLTASYPAFGVNTYKNNIESMSKIYSLNGKIFSFRPATTSESIAIASYGFGEDGEFDVRRDIFDPRWLQLNHIVRTSEGVYTNITKTDENALKALLNGIEKINGIYLINDKIAFAPYDSFKRGIQSIEDFAINSKTNGLARALEHTPKKVAKNLQKIASTYKKNVDVWGFDDVLEPILRVAGLNSFRDDVGLDV